MSASVKTTKGTKKKTSGDKKDKAKKVKKKKKKGKKAKKEAGSGNDPDEIASDSALSSADFALMAAEMD